MSQPKAVVLGHNARMHAALRTVFDVVYVVADAAGADMQWQDLQNLAAPLATPSQAALNDGSFETVLAAYQRFADINSRRFVLIGAPESETYNAFVATFYAVHDILTRTRPDFVLFHNFPHEGFDYIFYCVAKALGIRTIATHQCLIPGRFWICEDLETFGDFSRCPRLFDPLPSKYELPKTWFYMAGSAKDWSYQFGDAVMEVLRRPWRLPLAAIRYHHNRTFRHDQARTLEQPVEGESFVYFPLHMQPELTTTAMGGPMGRYADQISAIEQLSLIVPEGTSIYLKENPKQTAQQRGPLFYRRLEALPNVKFVPKELPSQSLIERSVAVASVTGTAGWEGLFFGKPVLVFGNAWYLPFRGVTAYRHGLTFAEWMASVPEAPPAIVAALDALLTMTGKGVVDLAHAVVVEGFDEERNAGEVAESLERYWQVTSSEAVAAS